MTDNNDDIPSISPFYAFLRSSSEPILQWISSYMTSNSSNHGLNSKEVVLSGRQFDIDSESLSSLLKVHMWFTYRSGFNAISAAHFITTDAGWGCMLRCGQMMLARALVKSYISSPDCDLVDLNDSDKQVYQSILLNFNDVVKEPFSIHQIVMHRSENESSFSSWFGPNAIAQTLRRIALEQINEQSTAFPIYLHVSIDQMIVVHEIISEWDQRTSSKNMPMLLIIPLRAGLKNIDSKTFKILREYFKSPQFVGFIGGRPRRALYLIGCADEQLLYLDPHNVQCYVSHPAFDDSTYHTNVLRWLHFENLDPSLALGFICKNKEEFWTLIDFLQKQDSEQDNKLFEVLNNRPFINNLEYEVLDLE
ncbi:hypothetical protein GJ496_007454 [Pomphorhynchus laevis]|nr:hypothetical protein GJ496_007454 [Pomphorhynchus laevis]